MGPILYGNDLCPGVFAVRLVANSLGLSLENKYVNAQGGETKTPEFLKMNPQHTIPVLDDNGFFLGESRAILCYLAGKFGKNDSLYPKDPKKRAIVDQRLFFDLDLNQRMFGVLMPKLFGKEPAPDAMTKIDDGLETLSRILDKHPWVAGENMTIADHAVKVTLSTTQFVPDSGIDIKKFPNIVSWSARVEAAIPKYKEVYEAFLDGIKKYKENQKKQ